MILTPKRLSETDLKPLLQRRGQAPDKVRRTAEQILATVQAEGDAAVLRLTKKFDGGDIRDPWLPDDAWGRLADQVDIDVFEALQADMKRIEAFHERQVGAADETEVAPGVTLGRRPVPYERVACYVPGGRASYPSTVLMTVVPARLAGVKDIIVATPPREDGTVDPAVCAAARLAGASRILRVGGVQAVAALAYGTQRIPQVDAIVGPGNAFVTEAKRIVSSEGFVHTDAPAGPSELLVLADGQADARFVAVDLLAQAEHDPDAQVLLVTDSGALAEAVAVELTARAKAEPRKKIIKESLKDHGALLIADSWDDAVAVADGYAPEHLEILASDPRATLDRIRNAGSVFLGPWAPVSLGDYGSGTNHVLPTGGMARIRGGLAVDDFRKWMTWQEVTREGLAAIASDITTVADAEGMAAHAGAVRERLG